jgi:uncharacterized protein with PhoU and TrkA domain
MKKDLLDDKFINQCFYRLLCNLKELDSMFVDVDLCSSEICFASCNVANTLGTLEILMDYLSNNNTDEKRRNKRISK